MGRLLDALTLLSGEEFSSGNGRFFKRARKEMTSSSKQVHSSDFIWHTFYFNDRVLAMLEEVNAMLVPQGVGLFALLSFSRPWIHKIKAKLLLTISSEKAGFSGPLRLVSGTR